VIPRVLTEAEAELAGAMLYYEGCREGLGAEFLALVTETVLAIGDEPLRYPRYEGKQLKREFRRAKVDRFPYIVVYEVRANETLIVAVAHTSREPGYWEHRE
jgi:hypothetical protein